MIAYPKFKPSEKRGNRLSEQKIKQIKKLFASGLDKYQIALRLGISHVVVRIHIDPEFRKKKNKLSNERMKKKYHNDLEFKRKLNETRRKNLLIQRQLNPKLDEYNRKKSKEFRKKKTIK